MKAFLNDYIFGRSIKSILVVIAFCIPAIVITLLSKDIIMVICMAVYIYEAKYFYRKIYPMQVVYLNSTPMGIVSQAQLFFFLYHPSKWSNADVFNFSIWLQQNNIEKPKQEDFEQWKAKTGFNFK